MDITVQGDVLWIHKDKPPLRIRNLAARVAARNTRIGFAIRWLRCGRQCAHGRAYKMMPPATSRMLFEAGCVTRSRRYIRLYYGVSEAENRIVVLHEMAHQIRGTGHWHDDAFYRALLREANAEGMLRQVVLFHGRNAKRVLRLMRAEERLTA